jgi:hypothetical protein
MGPSCAFSRLAPLSSIRGRLVFVNAARAVIPIEDVEDHDLEWLERWIAGPKRVP